MGRFKQAVRSRVMEVLTNWNVRESNSSDQTDSDDYIKIAINLKKEFKKPCFHFPTPDA